MKDKAYSKINLALNVIRRREDGYHELDSIMLPLTLHDEITIEESDHDYLTSNITTIPLDESNIAMKALRLMKETYHLEKCYHIHLEKRIPSEAGLGGGSADGASVMRLVRDVHQLNVSDEELAALSVRIGADVPFCIMNQPMHVRGIGEIMTPIQMNDMPYHVLLVKPDSGVSTKRAYQELDLLNCDHPQCEEIKKKLEKGRFYNLAIGNSLEESALRLNREVYTLKYMLMGYGFDYVLMSGSGSCVFALTKSNTLLEESYQFLKQSYKFVEKCEFLTSKDLKMR